MTTSFFQQKTSWIAWMLPAATSLIVFFGWSPSAQASIVVEGDRQFTDDVNSCLNTYRDAPGIVGETIRELEESEHEHKILNSPDWSNASNDLDAATGGSGSGTVTRVDKDELEVYKRSFPELQNKDFCTALLHELWHAVDADRGSRTSHSEKIGGVKRNEVEATIFQNLIHAIRGVPPRTSYGGVDISSYVLTSDEQPQEESPTPTPPQGAATEVRTSFTHVKPGEYSEIYATVTTSPGARVDAQLQGPGVSGRAEQSQTANEEGVAKFTWKIVSYGTYVVEGTSSGGTFTSTINVE